MNTTTDDQPVVDAEVVDQKTAEPNGAQVLLDLEQLIKTHVANIDKGKAELKKQREMLSSALENDETYRQHNEEAKKAAKTKAQTKYQIMQLSQNKQLAEKVKSVTADIKEADGALSDYLREYQRMSGSTEIETDDGVVREIVYTAKLVKRSK
jgi:hypothetical protein